MAAYFHGNSEIQSAGDGLQTLILMNPGYIGYSNNQPPPQQPGNNFVFLNSAGGDRGSFTHAPPSQTQPFVGIPLHGVASVSHQEKDVTAPFGFLPYNLYSIQADLAATRDVTRAQQGLSLSLSSQQPLGYGSFRPEREGPSQVAGESPIRGGGGGDELRVSGGSPSSASAASNGVTGVQSVLFSSKYLKAAQELLDDVVNVGKGTKNVSESSKTPFINNVHTKNFGDSSSSATTTPATTGDAPSGGEGTGKRDSDLTTAERQEIQMKKAKLVNMLDEVELRYRNYHHQMQSVVSWFEQNAGIGSARSYTALALQTISKQFRCLKDAILQQIRSASQALGEDDNIDGKTEGSRLKYVDDHIRQQRALQQLGMIQHNAWRPQRGLQERSVSVLRAWLFEHFLHPYPKDSDKLMLAKQTGLTRSQVSNWFINARVRLWKPMVEEMYIEEMKEQGRNLSDGKNEYNDESTSKTAAAAHPKTPVNEKRSDKSSLKESPVLRNPSISTSATSPVNSFTAFNLVPSSGLESIAQPSPKKLRTAGGVLQSQGSFPAMNSASEPTNEDNNNIAGEAFTLLGAPTNFIGGFGSYSIGELGRFTTEQYPAAAYPGNGVSLTLGLPHSHCDNISIQGTHQSFLPNQSIQMGNNSRFSLMNSPAPPPYEKHRIIEAEKFLHPASGGIRWPEKYHGFRNGDGMKNSTVYHF